MITSTAFAGKSYAVLGLARSGVATVEALVASGAEVMAWDDARRGARGGRRTRRASPIRSTTSLYGYSGIVVSPGVPINRHPIADRARGRQVPLIGDIELFAQARPSLPPHQVVGITGTNGKSTTTALIHHILEDRRRSRADGRQYRPADPRAGSAARGRRLCARTVLLPDRPDAEPRLRHLGAAQRHARSSRPL